MNRAVFLEKSYTRQTAFSYACHACNRCCRDKVIHVNPYEVARLAAKRGMRTTEFLARYTGAGGTALKQTESGACVFLTAEGCGVHPDRPLVCRIYPLGRRVTAEGAETFHELAPHPQTEGQYGQDGTVQDYLTSQGAEPFIEAVDRYVGAVGRLTAALTRMVGRDPALKERVQEIVQEAVRGTDGPMADWLDMDRVVDEYCARQGFAVPSDVSGKMDVHIRALEASIRNSH